MSFKPLAACATPGWKEDGVLSFMVLDNLFIVSCIVHERPRRTNLDIEA